MPRENHLTALISFRLDTETSVKLAEMAQGRGMTPSSIAREAVLKSLGTSMAMPATRKRIAHGADVRAALAELGREGSNLNQISRALNRDPSDSAARVALVAMRDAHERALGAITTAICGKVDP